MREMERRDDGYEKMKKQEAKGRGECDDRHEKKR